MGRRGWKRNDFTAAGLLNRVERWLRKDPDIRALMSCGKLYPVVTDPDEDGDARLTIHVTVPKWGEFTINPSHMIDASEYVGGTTGPDLDLESYKGEEVYWKVRVLNHTGMGKRVVAIDEFATLSDAVLYLETVYY